MRRSSRRARVNARLGLWRASARVNSRLGRAAASAAVNRPLLPLAPLQRAEAEPRLQPRTGRQGLPRFAALLLLLLTARAAPAQAIGQGFELERAGHHQQAVTVYLATVRADPTNVPALLGLERVLPLLGRLAELLPLAQHAVAASPQNGLLRALLLRTYVGLNEPDSARAAALRWVADAPGDV